MDVITFSKNTKIHTTHIVLSLGVDEFETTSNIFCPFVPDRIELKNVYFDNASTNGDNIFLMSSSLFEPFSKYSLALDSGTSFSNVNLSFNNYTRDVTMTHSFEFKGITGSTVHDAQINIVLAVELLKY